MTERRRGRSCIILMLLILGVASGASWAVWELVSIYVSPTATRAWALIATLLLPAVAWAGYSLGQSESRGKLAGIDAGLERVTRAASQAIDLRASAARTMRQAVRDQPVVTLPPIEPIITIKPQITSGEAIEM